MSRYYFHFRDAISLVPDDEGTEFATLEEAVSEARASAKDMALVRLREGGPIPFGAIEMTRGEEVLIKVPLRDILQHD